MSDQKYPPRVSMGYRKGSTRPFVTTQPLMDCQNHVYLSEMEHDAILAEKTARVAELEAALQHYESAHYDWRGYPCYHDKTASTALEGKGGTDER